jgi:hypothetical protein
MGIVWRRSTTPITACKGDRSACRSPLNFITTPAAQIRISILDEKKLKN